MRIQRAAIVLIALAGGLPAAIAGEADVVGATAQKSSDGTWRFDVTVRHKDTGWDHYANRWDVLAPDGTILGTRTLLHPHETEQPFTRSLGGVKVPDGVTEVSIHANDSVHGTGSKEFTLKLAN
jgi:hypothetical protein